MLALIQIINHMVTRLEYSDLEIDDAFTQVVNGDETVGTLLDALNLELSPTSLQLAQEKVGRWESAFVAATGRNIQAV